MITQLAINYFKIQSLVPPKIKASEDYGHQAFIWSQI